jgi:hypothetical protein
LNGRFLLDLLRGVHAEQFGFAVDHPNEGVNGIHLGVVFGDRNRDGAAFALFGLLDPQESPVLDTGPEFRNRGIKELQALLSLLRGEVDTFLSRGSAKLLQVVMDRADRKTGLTGEVRDGRAFASAAPNRGGALKFAFDLSGDRIDMTG